MGERGSEDKEPDEDRQLQISEAGERLALIRADIVLKRDQARKVRKETELLDLDIKVRKIELELLESTKEETKLAKRVQALVHAYHGVSKMTKAEGIRSRVLNRVKRGKLPEEGRETTEASKPPFNSPKLVK